MSAHKAKKTKPNDTLEVETETVPCNGGGGALGHPTVYLKLVHGEISCPYCSQHFKLKAGAKVGGH